MNRKSIQIEFRFFSRTLIFDSDKCDAIPEESICTMKFNLIPPPISTNLDFTEPVSHQILDLMIKSNTGSQYRRFKSTLRRCPCQYLVH